MSKIVYGQRELDEAIKNGIKVITLCAGIYNIPKVSDTVFDRLGPVKASVGCTKRAADAAGMIFNNIYPEYMADYAVDYRADMNVFAVSGSSHGSYGSYGGSYGSNSGLYGLYSGSFGSYGSHNGIYGIYGLYSGSYGSYGSYSLLYGSSYPAFSSGGISSMPKGYKEDNPIFGYGIDLI